MATDKTGASTEVVAQADRFVISVDGEPVGLAAFTDHDNRRIFTHTEVADAFNGRGLGTMLVGEALQATRDAGLRIVAVCSMVAAYLDKHPEFNDVVDPVTADIKRWLS